MKKKNKETPNSNLCAWSHNCNCTAQGNALCRHVYNKRLCKKLYRKKENKEKDNG